MGVDADRNVEFAAMDEVREPNRPFDSGYQVGEWACLDSRSEDGEYGPPDAGDRLIWPGRCRGAEVAQIARGAFSGIKDANVPGLNRLTTRELEIVSRLLEGDRTPAIALELFLSQSTVRTHLASVFTKLGVTSQQELLNAFRTR